jgi:hypothetical protein
MIKVRNMNTNTSGKSCELTEQELDGVTGGELFKYEATPTIRVPGIVTSTPKVPGISTPTIRVPGLH